MNPTSTLSVSHTPFADRKNGIPARAMSPDRTRSTTGVPRRARAQQRVDIDPAGAVRRHADRVGTMAQHVAEKAADAGCAPGHGLSWMSLVVESASR
jgi:hypothetical protein